MLGTNNPSSRPSTNALELIMPPAFDEKLVTSDEDRKQLRLVAIALAERFVNHLFGCDPETSAEKDGLPPLSEFIYRVIRRTNSSLTTLFVALIYLIRLKQKHPACKGTHSSPHRLLLASIIISYKYLYDNCYHNRSWAQVSQGLFKLEEINKMEVELLFFLGFQLYVSKQHWAEFVEFMDGKLTRSLSQTSNQVHLRKVLWVELFPSNGLHKLHQFTAGKEPVAPPSIITGTVKRLPSTRRSVPSLRPSASASTLTSSDKNPSPSSSSTSSSSTMANTPTSNNNPHPQDNSKQPSHQRMLLTKVSSVFSKPGDTLSHAWLDLHSSILPGRRRRDSHQSNSTSTTSSTTSNSSTDHIGSQTIGSKSVLSNVTLRSHQRRSQKFSIPPIWNLMSNSSSTTSTNSVKSSANPVSLAATATSTIIEK